MAPPARTAARWAGVRPSKGAQAGRDDLLESALDAEPVATLVRALRDQVGPGPDSVFFSGTATALMDQLVLLHRKGDERKRMPVGWPPTPNTMSSALTRAAPSLRAVGIEVERSREGRDRSRTLTLRQV